MSKRTTEETTTTEFSFDDSNEQLRKKIKLLSNNIIKRIKEIHSEIDINEHKVHKFLLIFHSLFEKVTSEETFEETDGILNDTIMVVCNIIAGLLKNNIDSLKLPAILKTTFKKLKNLFVGVKEAKSETKSGESEWRELEVKENAENSVQAKETNGPSGEGREEQRQDLSEE